MSNTDQQLPTADRPKQIDTRVNRIQGRLKAALDKMVWDAMDYATAAQAVHFTTAAMRKALQRPHVLAYIRNEREVLRASLSPSNIHRLREIRDAANNMPAVNAIKVLELIGDEQPNSNKTTSPGVTIRILNQTAVVAAPTADEG